MKPRIISMPISNIGTGFRLILNHAHEYAISALCEYEKNRFYAAYLLTLLAFDELGKFFQLLGEYRTAYKNGSSTMNVRDFYDHTPKFQRMVRCWNAMSGSAAFALVSHIAQKFNLNIVNVSKTVRSKRFKNFLRNFEADPKKYREAAMYVDYRNRWMKPKVPSKNHLFALIKIAQGTSGACQKLLNEHGTQYLMLIG